MMNECLRNSCEKTACASKDCTRGEGRPQVKVSLGRHAAVGSKPRAARRQRPEAVFREAESTAACGEMRRHATFGIPGLSRAHRANEPRVRSQSRLCERTRTHPKYETASQLVKIPERRAGHGRGRLAAGGAGWERAANNSPIVRRRKLGHALVHCTRSKTHETKSGPRHCPRSRSVLRCHPRCWMATGRVARGPNALNRPPPTEVTVRLQISGSSCAPAYGWRRQGRESTFPGESVWTTMGVFVPSHTYAHACMHMREHIQMRTDIVGGIRNGLLEQSKRCRAHARTVRCLAKLPPETRR